MPVDRQLGCGFGEDTRSFRRHQRAGGRLRCDQRVAIVVAELGAGHERGAAGRTGGSQGRAIVQAEAGALGVNQVARGAVHLMASFSLSDHLAQPATAHQYRVGHC